jgi:uncharacterized protein (TIRG00374 family)
VTDYSQNLLMFSLKSKNVSSKLMFGLKLIVAFGLIFYLFYSGKISVFVLKDLLNFKSFLLIFLCGALVLCIQIFRSFRLWLLLRTSGVMLPFGRCAKTVLIGFFYNNFLPTSGGGDIVVGYYLATPNRNKLSEIVGTLLYDRFLGLLGLALLALCAQGLILYQAFGLIWPGNIGWGGLGITGALIAIFAFTVIFGKIRLKSLENIISRVFIGRLLLNLLRQFSEFGTNWRLIFACIGISLVINLVGCTALYMVSVAMNGEISFVQTIVLGLQVFLIGMIPLSPGNIGWQEWWAGLVWSSQDFAFGASLWLVYRMVAAVSSLAGAVLYLSENRIGEEDEGRVLSSSIG